MDFALLGISKLQVFLLVLTRTAGIFTLTPTFGSNHIPPYVRMAMALGLGIIFLPLVGSGVQLPDDVPNMVFMIAREAMIGLAIGFICMMVFVTIETAGHFIDAQSGFSFAASVDPATGNSVSVASKFHNMLAILIFFATNCHHVLLMGLAESFRMAPVGQVDMNPAVANGMVSLFSSLFIVSIRISAPIFAALFLADIALAMISRVIPQMNVFVVGLPLKLGLALVGLLIAIPYVSGISHDVLGGVYNHITSFMSAAIHP